MFSEDTVGETTIKVWNLLGANNGDNIWHKIFYNKKEAGELRLETKF